VLNNKIFHKENQVQNYHTSQQKDLVCEKFLHNNTSLFILPEFYCSHEIILNPPLNETAVGLWLYPLEQWIKINQVQYSSIPLYSAYMSQITQQKCKNQLKYISIHAIINLSRVSSRRYF